MNIADNPNEDISFNEALDSLRHNDDVTVLVGYLRSKEPTGQALVALTQMLSPNYKHEFHFHLRHRKAGKPKASLNNKSAAHQLMSREAISAFDLPELADMLAPDSSHPFILHVNLRNR